MCISILKCCFPCCFSKPAAPSPPSSPAAVAVVPSLPSASALSGDLRGRISSHQGSTFTSLHPASGSTLAGLADVAARVTYTSGGILVTRGGPPFSATLYPSWRSEGPGEHSAVGRPPSPSRRLGAGAGGAAGVSGARGLELDQLTLDLSRPDDPEKLRAAGLAALNFYRGQHVMPDFREFRAEGASDFDPTVARTVPPSERAVERVMEALRQQREEGPAPPTPELSPRRPQPISAVADPGADEPEALPSPERQARLREVSDRLRELATAGMSPRASLETVEEDEKDRDYLIEGRSGRDESIENLKSRSAPSRRHVASSRRRVTAGAAAAGVSGTAAAAAAGVAPKKE